MSYPQSAYPITYDLSNCDQEPLHLIRLLQNHACMLACERSTFKIIQASVNTEEFLGVPHPVIIGKTLYEVIPSSTVKRIQAAIFSNAVASANPIVLTVGEKNVVYNLVFHLNKQDLVIIELEPRLDYVSDSGFLLQVDEAVQHVQATQSVHDLLPVVAHQIRRLTDYDRVMIYQFDQDYNGEVVAEAKRDDIEPFFGLHYPASDIPRQARELYLLNQIRIIVDTESQPVAVKPMLHPITSAPLDLTLSVARGVSPIHIEYLTNMGVRASLSIAIQVDGKLWGLIACHHYSPKLIDYRLRSIVAFIGKIISSHLALQATNDYRKSVLHLNILKSRLVEQMSTDWNIRKGLTEGETILTDLNESSGAAILLENQLTKVGDTPTAAEIHNLIDWLNEQHIETVFQTHELPKLFPPAIQYKDKASGLLAVTISPQEYVLWFKPEVIQTVFWGGNPEKAVTSTEDGFRLSPRTSFAKWKQVVENTSTVWKDYEIDSALALRSDIKDFIVQKYNEVKQLNAELIDAYEELESFSYTVSHDLRAPLRTIEGFVRILEEDYGEQLDEYGISVIQTIINSVAKMNLFIDDILKLSKLNKNELIINDLDVRPLLREIADELVRSEPKQRQLEVIVADDLPTIFADRTLIHQLFTNLISNSIKYTRNREQALIVIEGKDNQNSTQFSITDNGIGFDTKYADKIFGIFSRLVTEQEYEGTGVGLAIVHRIVLRHKGKIWVESQVGKGTTFYIEFPKWTTGA